MHECMHQLNCVLMVAVRRCRSILRASCVIACVYAGEAHRDDPYPVDPKVWAALNRRLFYIIIINGFMGRSGEWLLLLRDDVKQALAADKDFVVCEGPTSLHLT